LAEVVIPPRSGMVGQPVFPGMITPSGDLVILAIQRRGENLRAAGYVDLNPSPSELPVQLPTKLDFVINAKNARHLARGKDLTCNRAFDS
jgi:hypothetical protein